METKNIIIQNYAVALVNAANAISNTAISFNDNDEQNAAVVKTLNVLVESLRSQTVIIQGALDNYNV